MSACAVATSVELNTALHHIDDVQDWDITPQVDAVLGVVSAHGLSEVVSVDRLHKHYELGNHEFVTYRFHELHQGGQIVASIDPMTLAPTVATIPVSFAVLDGRLVVTAVLVKGEHTAGIEAMLELLSAKVEFLEDALRTIQEVDASRTVGLSLRFDAVLGASMNEKTFDDRHQTLRATAEGREASSVITSWVAEANQDGSGKPWTRSCSRYCEWGPFKGHVTIHRC